MKVKVKDDVVMADVGAGDETLRALASAHRRGWRAASGDLDDVDDLEDVDSTGLLIEMVEEGGLDPLAAVHALISNAADESDPYLGYVAATVLEWVIQERVRAEPELGARIAECARSDARWSAMLRMVWLDVRQFGRLPSVLREQMPKYEAARRRVLLRSGSRSTSRSRSARP